MRQTRPNGLLAAVVLMSSAAGLPGCGEHGQSSVNSPAPQKVILSGQYNLVLNSATGQGVATVYATLTQTGTTFAGTADTVVCRSNDASQCRGGDTSPIVLSGTVRNTDIEIAISFTSATGPDRITMIGSSAAAGLGGTYTDTLGDTGKWSASIAVHRFSPAPAVYDYSGNFNSTANPLLIAPTISMELGLDTSSRLIGKAAITNSSCIHSLSFSGRVVGDALILTDAAAKAGLVVLPTQPTPPGGTSFSLSYRFESDAPACAGDVGRGTLTMQNASPWDY